MSIVKENNWIFFSYFWVHFGLSLLINHFFSLRKFLFLLFETYIYKCCIDMVCILRSRRTIPGKNNSIIFFSTSPTSSNCHLSCWICLHVNWIGWKILWNSRPCWVTTYRSQGHSKPVDLKIIIYGEERRKYSKFLPWRGWWGSTQHIRTSPSVIYIYLLRWPSKEFHFINQG